MPSRPISAPPRRGRLRERVSSIRRGLHDTTMLLALVIWLCVVPFVLALTLPFFGWQGGLVAAIVTLLLALVLCWRVCLFPQISPEGKGK